MSILRFVIEVPSDSIIQGFPWLYCRILVPRGIPSYLKRYGRGGTELFSGHKERMSEIRKITFNNSLDKICKENASRLVYPMSPNYKYLCREWTRNHFVEHGSKSTTKSDRFLFLQNQRMSFASRLSQRFLKISEMFSRLSRSERFLFLEKNSDQVDCIRLKQRIQRSNFEVKRHSNGSWPLLFDNCRGHNHYSNLSNVRIKHLLSTTTTVYQPLNQCIISHT